MGEQITGGVSARLLLPWVCVGAAGEPRGCCGVKVQHGPALHAGSCTVLPYLQEPRDVPLVVDPHGHHVLKHPEEGALLARLGPGVVEQVVELEEKPPGPFCTGGSGSAGWRPAAAPQGRLQRGRGGRRAWVETAFGRWPPRSAAQSGATKDQSETCGPGSEHPGGTRPSGEEQPYHTAPSWTG